MPSRPLRGFTLLELILACALFSVLGVVVLSLLVAQFRIVSRVSRKVEVERSHLLFHEVLRSDILSTSGAGISLEPVAGSALAVQPVEGASGEGVLHYVKDRLIGYRFANERLQRFYWETNLPLTLQDPPDRLSGAQWTNWSSVAPVRTQTWPGVRAWRVRSEATAGQVSPRIWVDCTWLDRDKTWRVSYCFFTRQNP